MDLEKAFNTFKISDYLHMFKNNHSILIYEEITIEEPFIIIKCESHYCKKIYENCPEINKIKKYVENL